MDFNYSNNFHKLTNFDPLSWFKVVVVTFFVQWVQMVTMFIWHVVHKGVPLSKDKATKTRFGGSGRSIQMSAYPSHPVLDDLTALLLVCLQELLGDWSCYVPNNIVMGGFNTDLSNPLCNTTVKPSCSKNWKPLPVPFVDCHQSHWTMMKKIMHVISNILIWDTDYNVLKCHIVATCDFLKNIFYYNKHWTWVGGKVCALDSWIEQSGFEPWPGSM